MHREFEWTDNKCKEGMKDKLVSEQLDKFLETGEPPEVQRALEGYNQQKKLFKEILNTVESEARKCKLP